MAEGHIAVVGGGVSGLTAAWLLSRRYRVTLFERNGYVGGHTHTVEAMLPEGAVPVDTGFIVYNEPNYPGLTALFRHLGVPTRPSDMSFALSVLDEDIEWSGDNLGTLFARRRHLLSPRFLRMVVDILRFNRHARGYLRRGVPERLTLGDYLRERGLGRGFTDHYLLPMAAAIWSCPQASLHEFPLARFLRFFDQHGLIRLGNRPQWRTVQGGGREYVQRMLPALHAYHINTPVRRVQRTTDGVTLFGDGGCLGHFDQVVLGGHADESLAMLAQPSDDEAALLGRFRYQSNEAVLHTDPALMPRRRAIWASWNHLTRRDEAGRQPVSVTYWMNRLQGLTTHRDLFVTLNPAIPVREEQVLRRMHYSHPVFDRDTHRAQQGLPRLQGRRHTWFCGSYFGYGFHEDGVQSAVRVAWGLGVAAPWATTTTADTATDIGPEGTPDWAVACAGEERR
ncbi:NAD(P)/FAD-dependent oxidoreductase [Alkalilimnicola ehrlichii MLHE-1]|uniref:Amine oxidase n=1 Tax=Alkalilimnicola ehrlichii (strain ATCC BAA-1101 / DSM 17681 / MLHE-1) TaxID=187272 RepID=Q0A6E2_ALKEH|nr:FAD-dependent oxidoreductase [Alkalilimnicola ehrlichii]ABI57595.1 amine oxidase [Alkalilimnicola ehrlichii MLHE-1]